MRALVASALLLTLLAGCADQPCANGATAKAVAGPAVEVAWTPVGNATAYFITRSVDGGSPEPYAVVGPDPTSFVDSNVTAGHTYGYGVATSPTVELDACSAATASVGASVPFFTGPGAVLAVAGSAIGVLLVLLRRR